MSLLDLFRYRTKSTQLSSKEQTQPISEASSSNRLESISPVSIVPNRHAIIQCKQTRFVIDEKRLEAVLKNEITFILDLKPNNIEELLESGKTEAVSIGGKQLVTIQFCDCSNMASHKQS